MKISKTDLVKLIIEANNQGYNLAVKHADRNYEEFSADYRDAIKRAQDETEEVKLLVSWGRASAKSQAYEAGVKAERERAEASEPKLSVWFMPCGPMPVSHQGEVLGYPPGTNKIKAIKAIREAYGNGEGFSLKEVKDLVEIEPGTLVSCGGPLPQSKAVELYLQLQEAGFEVALRKP